MSKFLYTHRLFVSALQLLCCRTLRVRYSSPPSPFVHTEELCRPSSYHIDILCITYRREKLCKEQGERRNGAYYSDILFFFLVVSPSSLFCVYAIRETSVQFKAKPVLYFWDEPSHSPSLDCLFGYIILNSSSYGLCCYVIVSYTILHRVYTHKMWFLFTVIATSPLRLYFSLDKNTRRPVR